ncbi:MAG: hypothetical protein AB3N14_13240 [Flavobacteriaceae bacterium]
MAVLKKIKAATLMETLVATVLIVIIFMISSMLLNSMFANSIKSRKHHVISHMQRLKYELQNHSIQMPYTKKDGDWKYTVYHEPEGRLNYVVLEAAHLKSKKAFKDKMILNE